MKKITKIFIIIIFIVIILLVLTSIYLYYKNDSKVAILGYHGVLPKALNVSGDNLIMDSEKFEEQLKFLKKLGYKTMTLDEFYCWKSGKCKKAHKSVLITFDDGYQNNYDYAFELLKKYDMNAVVFCVGTHINMESDNFMNIDTISKSKEEYPNIEFASHSFNLHHRGNRDYGTVNEDIKQMKKLIDSKYYAYPYGEHNREYIKALKDNGYKIAFTFGPGKEHRKADISDNNYKIPRLNISNDMTLIKFIGRLYLPI